MKQIWTFDKCKEEALKYNTRVAFQKSSSSAYQISHANGWLGEICTHMRYLHFPWTKETVLEEMRKYKTISHFQKSSSGAYKAAVRFGILYDILPRKIVPNRKIPINEIVKRISNLYGDVIKIVENTYVCASKKAKFIDKEYGEWETWVGSVLDGRNHPDRVKKQIKETNLERYGTEHPMQNKALRNKANATVLKKYGTKNISSNEEIKAKKRETTLKNFGTEYPSQNEDVRQKQANTNLKKYGVASIMHDPVIALKNAKATNGCQIKCHWKTNKEIVCIGSYEAKTVDYLNSNKISYDWQPKVFEVPFSICTTEKGRLTTYRPDLYLADQDIWVEIKGYMRKDAQEKWDWFKSEHPNSELWDKKKLKEIGIL